MPRPQPRQNMGTCLTSGYCISPRVTPPLLPTCAAQGRPQVLRETTNIPPRSTKRKKNTINCKMGRPPVVASFFDALEDAINRYYAVLPDSQLVMDPLGMAAGGGRPMFRFDKAKVARVGLLPPRAEPGDQVRWFDVPGFNPLHVVNAWEEDGGNVVVLVAPNWFNMEHLVERLDLAYGHMEMLRIDLKHGVASRTPLSVRNLDFAAMNPAYFGRQSRYAYPAVGADVPPRIKGVAKLDLRLASDRRECIVACREYGPGCFGGEPFFVAREEEEGEGGGGEEDDGYLVSYIHDENSGKSRFVVMDAKSPELETVAEVALPRRVPYGFHGVFLNQSELKGQKPPPQTRGRSPSEH